MEKTIHGQEIVNELSFNVSSRFSQLIGRQLISNPHIAVLELIKNSYDADAKAINVYFDNLSSGNGRIIIEDNGDGMTLNDIINKWMVIGTENKVYEKFTKKGRRKLGEKGIGRFSVERLAEKAILRTTTEDSNVLVQIDIDWNKYEVTSDFFNEIKHPVKYEQISKDVSGTTIILEGLRDVWTEESVNKLRKEIFLLTPIDIGSFSSEFKKDVEIKLFCDEFPDTVLYKYQRLLKLYQAKLKGEVFENGDVKLEVELKVNKKDTRIESYVKFERTLKRDEVNYTCGPIYFEAYAFLRDFRLYKGINLKKRDISQILDEYCGIKIYRDDFRVKPFGDPNNDWLNLNITRVSDPEYRLATNQVIGGVRIARDINPGLQDVLSRENLYETQEYEDLKSFINSAFDYYKYASFVETRDKVKEDRDERKVIYTSILEDTEMLQKTIENARKHIDEQKSQLLDELKRNDESRNYSDGSKIHGYSSNDTLDTLDTLKLEDDVKIEIHHVATNEYISSIENLKVEYDTLAHLSNNLQNKVQEYLRSTIELERFKERELQIFRNIASLGISAAQFGHEVEKALSYSALAITQVNENKEIKNIKNDLLQKRLKNMEKDLVTANQKVAFLRGYLEKDKQDIEKEIDIYEIFHENTENFRRSFKEKGIDISIEKQENVSYRLIGYYGDFESIIVNLITNAYKALTQSSEANKHFNIFFKNIDDNIVITTSNSGKPIEEKDREQIFRPLFTTHIHGTGLGLTIIEESLKLYQGTITLLNDYPITKFEIIIPVSGEA